MRHKFPQGMGSIGLELASRLSVDSDAGQVSAVVAMLETPDAKKRIIHVGAVESQEVLVSDWDHSSVFGKPPVGQGRIWEEGDVLRAELQYDMEREVGREAFQLVRSIGNLGHWSVAYEHVDTEVKDDISHFWSVKMMEVSPTGWPASQGTYTVHVQSKKEEPTSNPRWELAQMKMKKLALNMEALKVFGG